VCGATSEKRKRPVVGSTWRARCSGGSPRSRSETSSRSSRSSTVRTRSSSIGSETIVAPVRAELTIEIARSPEDVFSYLTDVSNLPTWQTGVKSATRRDGRIEESRSLLGLALETTLEVVEQEKPHLFTLRALDGPVRLTVRHELEPVDDGTRLTV